MGKENEALMDQLAGWIANADAVTLVKGIELLSESKQARRKALLASMDVLDGKDPDAAPKPERKRRSDFNTTREKKSTIRHHENVEPVAAPEAPAPTVLDMESV